MVISLELCIADDFIEFDWPGMVRAVLPARVADAKSP